MNVEQLRAAFAKMTTPQKKQFIDNLRAKLQGSTNATYTAFLNECVRGYNAAVKGGASTTTETTKTAATPKTTSSRSGVSLSGNGADVAIETKTYAKQIVVNFLLTYLFSMPIVGLAAYLAIVINDTKILYYFLWDTTDLLSPSAAHIVAPTFVWLFLGGLAVFLIIKLSLSRIKVHIVKSLNHLTNSTAYNARGVFFAKVTPYMVQTEDNKLWFYTTFQFTAQGFGTGLSMAKVAIDGKEMSIRLRNSQSLTSAETTYNSNTYSIGDYRYTNGYVNTNYKTSEWNTTALTAEQFAFLGKLTKCQTATVRFVGAAGNVVKVAKISKRTKEAWRLMLLQTNYLVRNGSILDLD